MLFKDRKSGSLVAIDHSDILPTDSAVALYTHHLGAHGEGELPEVQQTGWGVDKDTDPSRTMPELTNRQHQGLSVAHNALKSRAADEVVKESLRQAKKNK